MLRIKSLVLWKVVVLIGLCALAIFGLWWWGLVHAPEAQGRARAQESLLPMERTIARELARAEATGLAFGTWWVRERGRLDDPESLQNVIPFLEKGAIITNLVLSAENGDSACVVRRDGEWNLALFRAGRGSRRFLVDKGRWVPGPVGEEVYEARERHWYRFGSRQRVPAWTPEAYPYFSSTVAGFTFTVPMRNAQGALEGVIGVDVSLEELTQLIWEHQPTPGTRMMVTDPGGRLLVPPRTPEMQDQGARFAHHLLPLPPEFLGRLDRGKLTGPSEGGHGLLASGRTYFSATESFAVEGNPRMRLHVAIPEEDLFPGLYRWRILTFLLALAALLGVTWSLLDLQRRIVRPMRELAKEADAPLHGSPAEMDFNSDIWELQRVGERLRVAGRAAQERTRLLSQVEHSQRVDSVGVMAPGIVHDVNNQLALVLGQISLCQAMLEDHPELQPRLRAAEGAAIKCAEVLRGLLDYSRPDPGRRELLSLNTLVEGAAALLRRVVGRSIQIQHDLAEDLPQVFGEPVKLQQVLVNLGLNARDAMPEGGLLVFRTFRAGENACLEVKDTGFGMSEDVKGRIFEPFFSTKNPGKGTGLGLAMVANIVAAHGGHIRVESEPGAGTCFRIEFPPSLRNRNREKEERFQPDPL